MSQNFVFPPPPPPPPPSTAASSIAFSPYSFQQGHVGGRGRHNSYQGSRGHGAPSVPQYNARPRYNNGFSGGVFGRDGGQSSGYNAWEGQTKPHWNHNYVKNQHHHGVLTANTADPNHSSHATESNRVLGRSYNSTMPGTSTGIMSNMFDGRAHSGGPLGGSPVRIGSKSGQSMLPDVRHYANGPPLNDILPSSSFSSQRVGQKRIHCEAFGASRASLPRTLTAPAVPAFGAPLPSLPTVQSNKKQLTKKKREHNQLGLTPRREEHESSEEEDVDEESKLAAAQLQMISSGGLRFSYKGRHATLSTPTEIAAWIEERKRRYPTQARVAEAAERKRKLQEADRIAREERKAISTRKRMISQELSKQEREKKSKKKQKDVANEQSKAEKLRRDLEKAQRRLASFEVRTASAHTVVVQDSEQPASARVECPRIEAVDPMRVMIYNSESGPDKVPATEDRPFSGGQTLSYLTAPREEADNTVSNSQPLDTKPHQLAKTCSDSQASISQRPERNTDSSCSSVLVPSITKPLAADCTLDTTQYQKLGIDDDGVTNDVDNSTSNTSSDSETDSESEDDTSSSGSSSAGSEPPESSTNCEVPSSNPVARPPRPKAICHAFLKNGRCHRGDQCRYRHELPERGSGAKAPNQEGKKKGARFREEEKPRMSLYQRVSLPEMFREYALTLYRCLPGSRKRKTRSCSSTLSLLASRVSLTNPHWKRKLF